MGKRVEGVTVKSVTVKIGDVVVPMDRPTSVIVYEGMEWTFTLDFELVARMIDAYRAGKRGEDAPADLTPELQAFLAGRRASGR